MTETVRSADGTTIAFERYGEGPAVVLVGGATNDRSAMAGVAGGLADRFTAVAYDRRGRGGSADTPPFDPPTAVEREVEDLAAVIGAVGGEAALFGHSSGGLLVIEAALRGLPVTRLVGYETPYVVDDTRPRPAVDLADSVAGLLAAGRRDDAVALFMTEAAAVPAETVAGFRQAGPMWDGVVALAHTLPYDLALFEPGNDVPADRLAKVDLPALLVDGANSPDWLRNGTRAAAAAIPGARYVTLPGEDHSILHRPDALVPTLAAFLLGGL